MPYPAFQHGLSGGQLPAGDAEPPRAAVNKSPAPTPVAATRIPGPITEMIFRDLDFRLDLIK